MTDPMNRTPGSVPPAWSPSQPTDETQTAWTPAQVPPTSPSAQPAPVPPAAVPPAASAPVFAQPESWARPAAPYARPAGQQAPYQPNPQPTWAAPAAPPAQPWTAPYAAPPVATAPVGPRKSGGIGVTTLVAAMLGTAVIASGTTYLAISAATGGTGQQPAAGVQQGDPCGLAAFALGIHRIVDHVTDMVAGKHGTLTMDTSAARSHNSRRHWRMQALKSTC